MAKTVETMFEHKVEVPGPWKTLAEVKKANLAAGKRFFDADKSKPLADIREGRFIITPDRDFFDKRIYRLHAVLDSGAVDPVGSIEGYLSVEAADLALLNIVEGRPELSEVEVTPGERSRFSELAEGSEPELEGESGFDYERAER